ncbi:hypothetical protein OCK74_22125 [Chitinophagaceae bacterium LB-8]|uniref:Uncharacterized protein n=1 Tax=Paraflavisolibacter caeni TaxID=2982496 RepID=A0A9X2XPP1_9BACT|nr:hypothetical protein [Paraflavisolibacter caeni]MCU7551833.1 hypothetical protein [Paraflavisolibacter caeni]
MIDTSHQHKAHQPIALEQLPDIDYEVRAQDTICVNESHLQHKWYHNIKYAIIKCCCRYLGIWLLQRKTAALMNLSGVVAGRG